MTNLKMVSSLAAASVLALAGCSKHENGSEGETTPQEVPHGGEPQPGNPPATYEGEGATQEGAWAEPGTPPAQSGAKRAAELNDAEIAKITDVVNSGEIQQARFALTQAQNPNVQQFASMMVEDHGRAKQNGAKLAVEQKMIPEESALATELADGAQETLQSLQTGDTATFDRRYIDTQVRQHQDVLDLLDKQLIPSAQNAQLKAELEKARGMVQRHLDQAKQIKAALAD